MLARSKRSAIVVSSSVFGQRPVGGASIVYSATKSLASFLAVGLSYELEAKIDVLAWEAGEVATKMSKRKAGGFVLSVDSAVRGMFRDIGTERITNGALTHDLSSRIISMVPLYYVNKMFIGIGNTVLKKQRARDPQVIEKKAN
jgi:short-subunit dehydrogenase